MSSRSLIYATFDRFPAPKGAAVHIRAFVNALGHEFSDVELVTVAGPQLAQTVRGENESQAVLAHAPIRNREPLHSPFVPAEMFNDSWNLRPNRMSRAATTGGPTAGTWLPTGVRHTELPALGKNLVERVLSFRSHLRAFWRNRRPQFAHVRSIFEGYPIARHKDRWCERLVFEVNGLPSVELKYHYPQVADDRELMRKLYAQEQLCLEAADLILTVSEINAAHLRDRGADSSRLHVIPNGVDTELFDYQPPRAWDEREIRLLYSGTMSTWQGVAAAIEAVALYRRDACARLTIVGHGRNGQVQGLRKCAYRLGVHDHVEFVETVSQAELVRLHHSADVVLVPLVPNDRNLVQGCCPLKVLEAMASGTPMIASDLPVVSALARPDIDALLVRPGSAKAIKDALLRFRAEPELREHISQNARQRVEQEYTWHSAQQKLIGAYRGLM